MAPVTQNYHTINISNTNTVVYSPVIPKLGVVLIQMLKGQIWRNCDKFMV